MSKRKLVTWWWGQSPIIGSDAKHLEIKDHAENGLV